MEYPETWESASGMKEERESIEIQLQSMGERRLPCLTAVAIREATWSRPSCREERRPECILPGNLNNAKLAFQEATY